MADKTICSGHAYMAKEVLRDYQQEMVERLEEAWSQYRSVMVQMPTGTGKTHLMAEVIRRSYGSVLIVAHRRELLQQIRHTIRAFGIDSERVVVESIQTLSRHTETTKKATGTNERPFALIVVDEAHHAVAKTYRQLWERWPAARFLGLTATPCRLSGESFTDLFDTLLQSWSIQTFIDKGWLSDFEYVSAAPDNRMVSEVRGLKKRGVGGDYQEKEMCAVLDVPESIAHLYETYKAFAAGKKGIVYAINRAHARHIADYYRSKGVRCEVIDSKTPETERQQVVEDYRKLLIDVLVNVDIFGEGFDVPEVEFIQLARPTLSLSKYLQQVGRGMRISAGKEAVLIIDQMGLYQTFGLPTEDRDWELMFKGKETGKGSQGDARGYVIRDDGNDPTLLNLEMVRIKRHGEKNIGVEIFMKGGRYGVLNDGKVTCAAEFEHIRRIKNGDFFAIASYPYAVFKGKTTIISLTGTDLKVSLYGKITSYGEVFEGETINGQRTFWDSIGQQYYGTRPEFETVGGVQMVRRNGKYTIRLKSSQQRMPVAKEDIWFNKHILWMKDIVVLKSTGKIYAVKAYGTECFYAESNDPSKGQYIRIGFDGSVLYVNIFNMMWQEINRAPAWGSAQMTRASSGKVEYLDAQYGKAKRVKVLQAT